LSFMWLAVSLRSRRSCRPWMSGQTHLHRLSTIGSLLHDRIY